MRDTGVVSAATAARKNAAACFVLKVFDNLVGALQQSDNHGFECDRFRWIAHSSSLTQWVREAARTSDSESLRDEQIVSNRSIVSTGMFAMSSPNGAERVECSTRSAVIAGKPLQGFSLDSQSRQGRPRAWKLDQLDPGHFRCELPPSPSASADGALSRFRMAIDLPPGVLLAAQGHAGDVDLVAFRRSSRSPRSGREHRGGDRPASGHPGRSSI